MTQHRGHCRCEGVVVSVSSEPEVSVYCHCDDCRRSSGAPLIAAVGMPKSAIRWISDKTLARWKNDTCARLFCNYCGSPIAQEHESAPDKVFFNTAFMDNPERFPPTFHSFEAQQLSWLELTDDLPRYAKTKVIKTD